ncbi:PREDICTED: bark storage protein A-like isoform X2 [Camelina sativa]|uniref:Bark storage protein A-like isoform X2 n=1 Tax=Camelina sativa TaxID=90675 RepID=A0ABM0UZH6_CAMSA|nr:PREDICTED: bark storage protein A-like isoform X2 [Camelina sativa]
MASHDHTLNCLLPLLFIIFISFSHGSPTPLRKLESAITIRKVNRRGPYIGLVTVFETEEDAFLGSVDFRPDPTRPFMDLSGRRFRIGKIHGKKVVYVRCGIGMVNAAAATQQMIDVFNVKGIVHFGIAGNINNSMSIGDNPDKAKGGEDVAYLDVGNYNVPRGDGKNELGTIGYSYEELYSVNGPINSPQKVFWINTTQEWLHLAAGLEKMELLQCVNASLCLPEKPKLVVGLKAATADIFVDNAAYRTFLYNSFGVSSSDMESSAVAMTCVSNGYPIIVIRGLSDLAGVGDNTVRKFGSLAATNTAKAVLEFIKKLPSSHNTNPYV